MERVARFRLSLVLLDRGDLTCKTSRSGYKFRWQDLMGGWQYHVDEIRLPGCRDQRSAATSKFAKTALLY
ncbi:hypothetical protein PDG61_05935 [Mycolicibacterium sp. BiH015]|uniref:hypothetical protein n=1 Tax=Mycolicibacterium sp. BiH015 TaxID=3018808 RepID=UPI0022E658B9|nr:hypothetical protein [Mycolicibacterium sp. BiH015]MDA2890441.1 hypothetical protein [Mycolicibacterium sp. BiH015]